jgi:hypothetical protein
VYTVCRLKEFFLHVDPQCTWVHHYVMAVYVPVSAYGTYIAQPIENWLSSVSSVIEIHQLYIW